MKRSSKNIVKLLIVSLTLSLSSYGWGQNTAMEEPGPGAMIADLVVVRPIMAGITVLGSAVWLLGLPFSAVGGNVKGSAETLVVVPARHTFVRCLGCVRDGRIIHASADEDDY